MCLEFLLEAPGAEIRRGRRLKTVGMVKGEGAVTPEVVMNGGKRGRRPCASLVSFWMFLQSEGSKEDTTGAEEQVGDAVCVSG